MPNIYSLSQINDSDLSKVGYKAWALSKAHQNKFSVPLSFIVPNHLFEEFLTHNRLNIEIRNILSGIQLDNLDELKSTYPKIKELFSKSKMPEEFSDYLKDAYSSLAVSPEGRSADDFLKEEDATINLISSPDYKTSIDDTTGLIMNIKGFNSFITGLKSAWLSLYAPQQIQMRNRKGIKDFNSGVIAQRMINADVTMEIFSKGPLGDYEIIVKSYLGLPDVTNTITKDIHSVSKDYLKIESSKIARQEFKILKGENKGTLERRNLGPRGEEQKIPDKEIMDAARITKRMTSMLRSDFKAFFVSKKGSVSMMMINLFPESTFVESDSNMLVSKAARTLLENADETNEDETTESTEAIETSNAGNMYEENVQENSVVSEITEEELVFEEKPQELEENYSEMNEENLSLIDIEEQENEIPVLEEQPLIEIYEQENNKPVQSAQDLIEEVEREELIEKSDDFIHQDEEIIREESEKKEKNEAFDDEFILSDKEED